MIIKGLVQRHLDRLNDEFNLAKESGELKRATTFHRWAVGRVLLGPEETKMARSGVGYNAGSDGLINGVYDAYMDTGEPRLVPAQTFDKNRKAVIVLVVQP